MQYLVQSALRINPSKSDVLIIDIDHKLAQYRQCSRRLNIEIAGQRISTVDTVRFASVLWQTVLTFKHTWTSYLHSVYETVKYKPIQGPLSTNI